MSQDVDCVLSDNGSQYVPIFKAWLSLIIFDNYNDLKLSTLGVPQRRLVSLHDIIY
jgi:hypothetical protein